MNYENAWIKYVIVISTADLKPQELIQSAFQVSKKRNLVCSRKHLEKLWSRVLLTLLTTSEKQKSAIWCSLKCAQI